VSTERALRSDARRNAEAVIDAARSLFAEKGVDVPMEQIGRAAGIGKGTLYRHFPTKDHLLAAVSRGRFDRLRAEADSLISDNGDPLSALTQWLCDFDRSAQHYRGMRAIVSVGIADEGSAIFADCSAMTERAGTLLRKAQETGQVRQDIAITELLSMVAALPERFRDEDGSSRLLEIVLRGITA
jgi:AcrR family transcriptional regulator